jgi:hypothetical protein
MKHYLSPDLMTTHLVLFSAAFLLLGAEAAAGKRVIPRGASVYIEEMDSDLDGFIRAEIVKQSVPLTVVLRREEAHLVLLGTSSGNEKRSWHEGWLTSEKDHAVGNVTLMDRSSGAMVWASEAGDRSLWWGAMARGGQRKVAARLVENLKDSVVERPTTLPKPPPLSADELAVMRSTSANTEQTTNVARAGSQKQAPLTNDDVVKMVKAQLAEDLVINKIKTSEVDFDLETNSLVALKKAGVPDKVMAAMMERQKP